MYKYISAYFYRRARLLIKTHDEIKNILSLGITKITHYDAINSDSFRSIEINTFNRLFNHSK